MSTRKGQGLLPRITRSPLRDTLEKYALPAEEGVSFLRDGAIPDTGDSSASAISSRSATEFADYIVFGSFQWARAVSPVALVEAGDPVFEWRERLLDVFGGFARSAPHCGA